MRAQSYQRLGAGDCRRWLRRGGAPNPGRRSRHERTRVLWLDHGNPARARNAGIRAATGRYVAFIDSDDLWEPSALERAASRSWRGASLSLVLHRVHASRCRRDRCPAKRRHAQDCLSRRRAAPADRRARVGAHTERAGTARRLEGRHVVSTNACEAAKTTTCGCDCALLSPVAVVDESLVTQSATEPESWSSRALGLFQVTGKSRRASLAARALPNLYSSAPTPCARAWNALSAAKQLPC